MLVEFLVEEFSSVCHEEIVFFQADQLKWISENNRNNGYFYFASIKGNKKILFR